MRSCTLSVTEVRAEVLCVAAVGAAPFHWFVLELAAGKEGDVPVLILSFHSAGFCWASGANSRVIDGPTPPLLFSDLWVAPGRCRGFMSPPLPKRR